MHKAVIEAPGKKMLHGHSHIIETIILIGILKIICLTKLLDPHFHGQGKVILLPRSLMAQGTTVTTTPLLPSEGLLLTFFSIVTGPYMYLQRGMPICGVPLPLPLLLLSKGRTG